MLAQRLPPLWVFAGGCLSGALLLSWWHEDAASTAARRATPLEPPAEVAELPSAAPLPAVSDATEATSAQPAAPPHSETGTTPGAERGHDTSTSDARGVKDGNDAAHPDAGTESGSSVAEVLARLEAAYRQNQPPTPAPQTLPSAAPAVTTAPAVTPPAPVAVAAAPVAPPPAAVAPTPAPTIVYLPQVAAVAAPASVPADAPSHAADSAASRPSNVSIGTLHQGDVYQVQQQLALLQYMQYLPLMPYAGYGTAPYAASPHAPRQAPPRRVPYPTTLTNPDNPWGYDFPNALWTVR
jgi:hypothetical protein